MQFHHYQHPDLSLDYFDAMLEHLVGMRNLSNPHHHFLHHRKRSVLLR